MLTKDIKTEENSKLSNLKANKFKLFHQNCSDLQLHDDISQLQNLRNSFNVWRENFLPLEPFQQPTPRPSSSAAATEALKLSSFTTPTTPVYMNFPKSPIADPMLVRNYNNYSFSSDIKNVIIYDDSDAEYFQNFLLTRDSSYLMLDKQK